MFMWFLPILNPAPTWFFSQQMLYELNIVYMAKSLFPPATSRIRSKNKLSKFSFPSIVNSSDWTLMRVEKIYLSPGFHCTQRVVDEWLGNLHWCVGCVFRVLALDPPPFPATYEWGPWLPRPAFDSDFPCAISAKRCCTRRPISLQHSVFAQWDHNGIDPWRPCRLNGVIYVRHSDQDLAHCIPC